MPNFAIHDDNTVLNIIVADSLNTAQDFAGNNKVFLAEDKIGIGWINLDGTWYPPKPYPSWVWDGISSWRAPVPNKYGDDIWDEVQQQWIAGPYRQVEETTENE